MTVDVGLDAIGRKLQAHQPQSYQGPAPRRRAAVATVLREASGQTEVLLILRAERAGDPWSGHIAFPGGHAEPQDRDLLATARREAWEEVGFDLSEHRLLGRLSELPARAGGSFAGVVITPFVFALGGEVELRPNAEVAGVFWAPLLPMVRGEVDAKVELSRHGETARFPGYAVDRHIVWGLTHRILGDLFRTVS